MRGTVIYPDLMLASPVFRVFFDRFERASECIPALD